jgi:hypothetical protein
LKGGFGYLVVGSSSFMGPFSDGVLIPADAEAGERAMAAIEAPMPATACRLVNLFFSPIVLIVDDIKKAIIVPSAVIKLIVKLRVTAPDSTCI